MQPRRSFTDIVSATALGVGVTVDEENRMSLFRRSRLFTVAALVSVVVSGAVIAQPAAAQAATCSDIDVVFARGTGETPGLGVLGSPLVRGLTSELSEYSVTSYAVDYAANQSQTSAGPGSADMSNHISAVAAACPGTRFVIGGYSQGGTVTDLAVGIRVGTTSGTPIPSALSGRVAAVVVFGNPLGARGHTIKSASAVYGSKSRDYCNVLDAVCGRRTSDPAGLGSGGHSSYRTNGAVDRAVTFAAALVRKG